MSKRFQRFLFPILAVVATTWLAGCSTIAMPETYSGRVVWHDDRNRVEVAFNDEDRRRIHDYYRDTREPLPPGLAKKNKLPPGLQKQITRNGKLPPGLEGRGLPRELERALALLPESYVRLRVGGDVVLMNEKTRVVVDIIYDVGTARLSSASF